MQERAREARKKNANVYIYIYRCILYIYIYRCIHIFMSMCTYIGIYRDITAKMQNQLEKKLEHEVESSQAKAVSRSDTIGTDGHSNKTWPCRRATEET